MDQHKVSSGETLGSLPLRCQCGKVTGRAGELAPSEGNHIICMCDDCQTYAHFLKQADRILDAHGGTAIFQTFPSRITITQGTEEFRCVRLSAKGLMRWYAGCCQTPIANTVNSAKVPFVGLVLNFVEPQFDREKVIGPLLAKTQGRFAKGGIPADAHKSAPVGLIGRGLKVFFLGWLKGYQRPSPFFNPAGVPLVTPTVLTVEEREALRRNLHTV